MKDRKILYRGLHRRFGEQVRMGDGKPLPSVWCYGGILQGEGDFSVIYGKAVQAPDDFTRLHSISNTLDKWVVYSDSVGQYVGFDDVNGKQIFEDDIVRINTAIYFFKAAVVRWSNDHARWCFETSEGKRYPLDPKFKIEVLGNVFDNPDYPLDPKFEVTEDGQPDDVSPIFVAAYTTEEPACDEIHALCFAVNRAAISRVNVKDVNAFLKKAGICGGDQHVYRVAVISSAEADLNFYGKGGNNGRSSFLPKSQWTVIDLEHVPEGPLVYGSI